MKKVEVRMSKVEQTKAPVSTPNVIKRWFANHGIAVQETERDGLEIKSPYFLQMDRITGDLILTQWQEEDQL